MLDEQLHKLGFNPTSCDPCFYVKQTRFDDMLVTAPSKKLQNEFRSAMSTHYKLSEQRDKVSYLGMTIEKRNDCLLVNQHGYLQNLQETPTINLNQVPYVSSY
jgi:hypothetical protein